MTRPLCIYHGNCADGFGAAWVVWKYFKGNVDLHAGVYREEPPDVTDRDVIIVDFSYPVKELVEIAEDAKSVMWLDHHKSAIDAFFDFVDMKTKLKEPPVSPNFKYVLDNSRSGAMLAWDQFFPGKEAPQLLKHVQDRDLWKFELKGTEEIQAALFSYPYDLKMWDTFMVADMSSTLESEGSAITRKHHKDIAELLKVTGRRMKIAGHDVPVANLPYTMSSDAGHIMAKGEKFAACYYDTPGGRCFSLRSSPDGYDVSEIARQFSGGGHKHAAGFRVELGWEGD